MIAVSLLQVGLQVMARGILLRLVLHLRPVELPLIRVAYWVPALVCKQRKLHPFPVAVLLNAFGPCRASMTGGLDISLLRDLKRQEPPPAAVTALVRARTGKQDRLVLNRLTGPSSLPSFRFTQRQRVLDIANAAGLLPLTAPRVVAHSPQVRLGGALHVFMATDRTPLVLQRHGRWNSWGSVQRYGK